MQVLPKKEAAAGDSSSNWKEIKLPFKSILLSNVSFSYEDQNTNPEAGSVFDSGWN